VHVFDLSSNTPDTPVLSLRSNSSTHLAAPLAISDRWLLVRGSITDIGGADTGTVLVYDLSRATPAVPALILSNPGAKADDFFGLSLAISGDWAVVGAALDDSSGLNSGRAYVYHLNAANPTVPILVLPNPEPANEDQFGEAVAISGMRVVIGTPHDDPHFWDSGSVYLYDIAGAAPTKPVATIRNPNSPPDQRFGIAVAISGPRLVVGAWGTELYNSSTGSAYVFDLSSASPNTPIFTLNNPSPAYEDAFGLSISISGTRVAIGAPQDDTGEENAGSVYLYDLAGPSATIPMATLQSPARGFRGRFGSALALTTNHLIAGAPWDDTTAVDKGAVYIYSPNSNDEDGDGLLDTWELAWWPTIHGHEPRSDFDGDDLTELEELAFGGNPLIADHTSAPAPTLEGGYLTMTLNKYPGAVYEVQTAGTLSPAEPLSFSSSSTTILMETPTTLKVRDNFPLGTEQARFMRVQVTGAP